MRARTQRLVRLVVTVVAALAIGLPLAAGPLAGAAVRLVGGDPVHRCLCGMRAGECGCPECAALEQRRQDERRATAPILRSSCEDDGATATGPALSACAQAPVASLVPAPVARGSAPAAPPRLATQTTRAPPTPPPRA